MANFKLTQTKEQIQADLDLLDKNSATAGQVLTANGTGGATWQDASGGGGGFTPRLLYPTEQLTHTGGHGTITRQDFCFDITATEVAQWSFTANVKCYVMATNNGHAYSYGKIVNAGESVGVPSYNSSDTHIKIYPINDYVSSDRIIGTFNCIQD